MGITSFLILHTMMTYENEYATYQIIEGILHVKYKNIAVDLPEAVYIVKDRLDLQEGQFMPVLCDIRDIKEINKAARIYLSIEGSAFIKAVAFIVESPVSEMLSQFYLRTSKPTIPTEAFDNIHDALVYLNAYR
ncbi:DUF7793 family protein [Gelidibacter salicanalis]|uniref:DUF7793 domain-containing protein n=1 Tax=Gelidibacter salicanalis TaxID=291193 RepID=A0A934KWI7_9FLAO|nr:hypothetical protein [Gelidibacter salicanalis]MBJ7881618.1 hypothetical protein [Gelidibacter salicanalis]